MPAMAPLATTLPSARQRSFLLWLGLAVLLHGLLLLLPDGRQLGETAVLQTLSVTLRKPVRPATEPESARPVAETPEAAPPALTPSTETVTLPANSEVTTTDPEALDPVEPAPPPVPVLAPPAPSAAHLFESTQSVRLPQRSPERAARLGRQPLAPPPPNWRSGRVPGDSRFDGRALPDRAEIVDRWLAADGSHNVLIETSSGEMYCGHASAWDPLQPLVEPVMTFRACGSGRTTFEWPEEYGNRPGALSDREAAR